MYSSENPTEEYVECSGWQPGDDFYTTENVFRWVHIPATSSSKALFHDGNHVKWSIMLFNGPSYLVIHFLTSHTISIKFYW